MKRYPLGDAEQAISLSDDVLAHLQAHRQLRFWQREAGGLLFARFQDGSVFVDRATGPRRTDRRWRHGYWPDRVAEQREIDQMHTLDLHFVGTWHTHPEDEPTPSGVDMRSMRDIFSKSLHSLNAFVMTIVGRATTDAGLYVAVWDGAELHELSAEASAGATPV